MVQRVGLNCDCGCGGCESFTADGLRSSRMAFSAALRSAIFYLLHDRVIGILKPLQEEGGVTFQEDSFEQLLPVAATLSRGQSCNLS